MTALPVAPNAEQALGTWLRTNAAVVALVGTRSAEELKTLPAIRYQLVSDGGEDTAEGLGDLPLVQVECWAGDRATAYLTASTVRAQLPTLGRTSPITGAYVQQAFRESGPFYSPDPDTDRPRYILTVRLRDYAT